MNLVDFLTKQRPICDKFPLYEAFATDYTLYAKLKDRSIADFGENLLVKRCANRFFCATECTGRPIPKYPELEPFLAKINEFEEGSYKGKPVWLVKVIGCKECPIQSTCTALCGSMVSFMDKHEPEEPIFEDKLIPIEVLEEYDLSEAMKGPEVPEDKDTASIADLVKSIPWDCLSSNQRYILQAKYYTMKSEHQIAKDLDIYIRAVQKQVLTAISKLKHYKEAREVLVLDKSNKIAELYYLKCLTQPEIAKLTDTSIATVSRRLKEFTDKHKLK